MVAKAVELTLDEEDDLPFKEESEDGEGVSYTFRELMDALIDQRDMILTVPSDQVDMLRNGLTTRKAKDNQKLSRAGIKVGTEVLSFLVYPAKDKNGIEIMGQTCIRVKLGQRKAVSILSMEIPDNVI
jgi:hypothetical protein